MNLNVVNDIAKQEFANRDRYYRDVVPSLQKYDLGSVGMISQMAMGAYGGPYLLGGGAKPQTPAPGRVGASATGGPSTSAFGVGDAIGVGAGLFGDIYGANKYAEGQEAANAANIQTAREQMRFQETMSSTAHLREVKDLERAGLNPVLSANAGASTPAGAAGHSENAGPDLRGIGSKLVQNMQTALMIKRATAEINEINSKAELNRKIADKTVTQTDIMGPMETLAPFVSKGVEQSASMLRKLGQAIVDAMKESIEEGGDESLERAKKLRIQKIKEVEDKKKR